MFPKGQTAKQDRKKKKRLREKLDLAGSDAVKARSLGQCERILVDGRRCPRRAVHVHHKLQGHGRRGRGVSALAEHKIHLCLICHWREHS